MYDAAWCRTRLDQLEDCLRRLGHCEERFAGVVGEARQLWRDAASREAFARFIDPCRADAEKTRKRLGAQLDRLRDVVARMQEAEKPAAEIQKFSEEAARLREDADHEMYTAHHRVDRALDEAGAALELVEQTRQVLAAI